MREKSYGFVISTVFLFVAVILLFVAAPANSAPDLSKNIRPTVEPGGGGGGGSGGGGPGGAGDGGGGHDGGPSGARCASVVGQVINWGFGPQEGVSVELKTGSWQASAQSASDGNYGLGGLGVGLAILHVSLAPEWAGQLEPLVQDAGIYLNCDFPTVANIALFSGSRTNPPATIQMSALRQVMAPGGGTQITLTLQNGLPNDITNAIVTDLLPLGLTAVDVSTSTGVAQIIDGGDDGQLVVVNLDKMAAGAKATIQIDVIAAPEGIGSIQLRNTATLFYRESAADQAWLDFTIGRGGAVAPAVAPTVATVPAISAEASPTPEPQPSPTPLPTATPLSAPPPTAEPEAEEEFIPPDGLPTTGDQFVPPDLLPITGQDTMQPPNTLPDTGLGLALPLSGLGLISLALLAHYWRTLNRRD